MKRFVIGDIHGAHKALVQCLERSGFDRNNDLLISLGDVCDGWPEGRQAIDELLSCKQFKLVMGNHDEWVLRWMDEGWTGEIWTMQGGSATIESYRDDRAGVPKAHAELLRNASLYVELDNKLFVHGGIDPALSISQQDRELLMWDRDLLNDAVDASRTDPERRFGKWDDIFIGHTPTQCFQSFKPIHACNVWALDTGSGWSGKMTIMDIDSHEYWQSEMVTELYPNLLGRTK